MATWKPTSSRNLGRSREARRGTGAKRNGMAVGTQAQWQAEHSFGAFW
jgi:hypothetical protein